MFISLCALSLSCVHCVRVVVLQAQIKINANFRYLGAFEKEEDAARKYDEAAAPLGRLLNFPDEWPSDDSDASDGETTKPAEAAAAKAALAPGAAFKGAADAAAAAIAATAVALAGGNTKQKAELVALALRGTKHMPTVVAFEALPGKVPPPHL